MRGEEGQGQGQHQLLKTNETVGVYDGWQDMTADREHGVDCTCLRFGLRRQRQQCTDAAEIDCVCLLFSSSTFFS